MTLLKLDDLEAGMILKADVRDRSNRLLLTSGCEITAKHLSIFRAWGVLEAEVTDEGSPETSDTDTLPAADCSPEELAAAEAEVNDLFRHNDIAHGAIHELMRICIQRKVAHD